MFLTKRTISFYNDIYYYSTNSINYYNKYKLTKMGCRKIMLYYSYYPYIDSKYEYFQTNFSKIVLIFLNHINIVH